MKEIKKAIPGQTVGIYMDRMQLLEIIDKESIKVRVPFIFGDNETVFPVLGSLNIASNLFHWDKLNEENLEPYFEGTGVDVVSEIENR